MKYLKIVFPVLILVLISISCNRTDENKHAFSSEDAIIRISKIEIDSAHIHEYISILREEAAASVEKEPGVIAIFPLFQEDDSTEIRILEIYADQEAYEAHLETSHFKHYKTSTQEMVKSLNLVDMKAIDENTMPEIFEKIGRKGNR